MKSRDEARGARSLLARSLWSLARVGLLLTLASAACGQGEQTGSPISDRELAERIQQGTAPVILDVRSQQEYQAGHIPGALNIPHDELPERLSELQVSEADEIVVHCEKGGRAGAAEQVLEAAGFTQVRDLDGHMQGWRAAGLPTE